MLALAAAVVMLSFGPAWAFITYDAIQKGVGNNGGLLESNSLSEWWPLPLGRSEGVTNIYFVKGTTENIEARVTVSSGCLDFGSDLNLSIELSSPDGSGWTAAWERQSVTSGGLVAGGGFSGEVVILTRPNADGFVAPEELTVNVKDRDSGGYAQSFKLVVVPVPITLHNTGDDMLPKVKLYRGETYSGSKGIAKPLFTMLSGISFAEWSGANFTVDRSRTVNVKRGGDIKGNSGVLATYSDKEEKIKFSSKTPIQGSMPSRKYYFFADRLAVSETDRVKKIPVAGVTKGTLIGQFEIEIAGPSMALSQAVKGFVVGDTPLSPLDDINLEVKGLLNRTINSLEIGSKGGNSFSSVATLDNLKISVSRNNDGTGGTVAFGGTASAVASGLYTVKALLSDNTSMETDLSVFIAEAGDDIETKPIITEPGTGVPTTMKVNEQARISFMTPAVLDMVDSVTVKPPNGADVSLPLLSEEPENADGPDGFIWNVRLGEGTIIDIYYTPTMLGVYGFEIIYTKNGQKYVQTIEGIDGTSGPIDITGSSSGGGGCSAGFGIAGILPLVGLALAWRRKRG